jgi:hypothetical protein
MKRLPVGWIGSIMIIAGAMWTAADLAVSGLVTTVNEPDRCHFNTSGLYEVITAEPFYNYISAQSYGNLFNLVTRAQATSQTNGGLEGIYEKVNSDLMFRADTQDVVGKWNCQDVGDDQQYPAGEDYNALFSDLASRNLLFENVFYCLDQYPDNTTNHFVAWSSPLTDFEGGQQTWDVRASIDMTANNKDEIVMKTYLCSMNATVVDWVLERTNPSTLGDWCDMLKGSIYENTLTVPPVPNLSAVIESNLDAIIMISGASISGPNLTTSPIKDPNQGCLSPKAFIPWPVLLLLIITIIGVAAILIYFLFLLRSVRKLRVWRGSSDKPEVPGGLLSWMAHAVLETGVASTVKPGELREWFLVPRGEEGMMRISRRDVLLPEDTANSQVLGWETGFS